MSASAGDSSPIVARDDDDLRYSGSTSDTKVEHATPSRSGTLRKTTSLRKRASLRRTRSGRSLRAGSMMGGHGHDDFDSVFHTPIPTSGTPTDVLAERFQAWRKLLKDLITYFREVQTSYETRSKALLKVSNVINNTATPSIFLSAGGIDEATKIFRTYHKQAVNEANKAKDIENDVITQLSGLRSDLNQKIKEIRSLSGDFKNSVDKEKDNTRKAVNHLQDVLAMAESDPSSSSGKNDPFIVRLNVDRQVEKQIEEENYLHRAYLNLEGSGRELESIVVGEIQKAYNAYAGILRREADSAQKSIEELRAGPLAMPKDHEWDDFVRSDPHFIDPDIPLRKTSNIQYPGQDNPAAQEIRVGPLERKSKYLKSYTPGWYVLSPTHLHEFKSPDHIHTQQPVMSLFLLDQKLGSHSQSDGTSHKFSLKGKQTGGIRGHSWVFRAESYDTMMAWYEDIKNLTEKTGAERKAFVRRHARSVSGGSHKAETVSSDGLEEDEADQVPYSSQTQIQMSGALEAKPQRPAPGGRFPSDLNLQRDRLQVPPSPSGSSSDNREESSIVAAASTATAGAAVVAASDMQKRDAQPLLNGNRTDDHISELDATPVIKPSAPPITAPAINTPESIQTGSSITDNADPRITATIIPAATAVNAGAVPQDGETTLEDVTKTTSAHDFAKPNPIAVDDVASSVSPSTTGALSPDTLSPSQALSPPQALSPRDAEHFRRTGQLLPSVLRHDTSMSASDLHVPGEFKRQESTS